MRMSPSPPGVFQYTSDPGHPDQVPWTTQRLHDSYSSHHRQISPPPGVFQHISNQVILIRSVRWTLRRPHDPPAAIKPRHRLSSAVSS
jgi:hypothetical protein